MSSGLCLSDVHVLSLSTGYWSSPQCSGDIPRARGNHTAVMWTPHLMLVFGGFNQTLAGKIMQAILDRYSRKAPVFLLAYACCCEIYAHCCAEVDCGSSMTLQFAVDHESIGHPWQM